MNIAFIAFDLPGEAKGGVAYAIHYLANALVSAGNRVTVFTSSPKPEDAEYEICRIKIPFHLKKIAWLKAALFPLFVAVKNFNNFDVVHSHGDSQYIFTKTPVVRTFYGCALDEALYSTTIFRFLYQLFYVYPCELISGLRANKKVVISRSIRKRYPFSTDVIYCGVDLNVFKPGQKSKNPVILYVGGSLSGRKRGKLLLEIFKNKLIKNIPNTELWLVCKEKVEARGARSFYNNLAKEEIAQLYQRAWLFCSLSRYEGLGIPYIEAMACGCAIVTTNNAGAEEILCNGKYGYLVKDDNLHTAMLELIKDSNKRQYYEKTGLNRARDFSLDKSLAYYISIYKCLSVKK